MISGFPQNWLESFWLLDVHLSIYVNLDQTITT